MQLNSPTIAIVDDHALFREAVCSFLRRKGYPVIMEAHHGKDLLNQLAVMDKLPDVCLLDIDMPVMDGYQTASILKEKYPTIKILAMTVFNHIEKRENILMLGADGFLLKSNKPETWIETIKKVNEIQR